MNGIVCRGSSFGEDGRPFCTDLDIDWDEFVQSETGLPDEFVRVVDGQFVIGEECTPLVFAGFNFWEFPELANDMPPPQRFTPRCNREHIVRVFNEAVDAGLKFARVWMHTTVQDVPLQTEPGQFKEEYMEGIDWAIDQARKRGLKLIIIFADNWFSGNGGIQSYIEWGTGEEDPETNRAFYTDDRVKSIYKDAVRTILNRENTVNGRVYKDDPTISMINLANEPRCQDCDVSIIRDWADEMSTFIRNDVGAKQLISAVRLIAAMPFLYLFLYLK